MDNLPLAWIIGFVAAIALSLIAWRLGALSRSGTVTAIVVGTLIVGTAGWWAGVILVSFFVSASALSHVSTALPSEIEQRRGNRRDAVQVLANGGLPCLLAVTSALPDSPAPWLVAYAAAVAAATSDTWATEVGRLLASTPRLLFSWRHVPPGTSGAVSAPGTTGAAAGATLIAGLAAMGTASGWWDMTGQAPSILVIVALAGFGGCLVDSVLGATVQAMNWCPACDLMTEQDIHRCGTPTHPSSGIRWMTNDVVNALAVASAAIAGLVAGAAIL